MWMQTSAPKTISKLKMVEKVNELNALNGGLQIEFDRWLAITSMNSNIK